MKSVAYVYVKSMDTRRLTHNMWLVVLEHGQELEWVITKGLDKSY
jgi:hypothetical protein